MQNYPNNVYNVFIYKSSDAFFLDLRELRIGLRGCSIKILSDIFPYFNLVSRQMVFFLIYL